VGDGDAKKLTERRLTNSHLQKETTSSGNVEEEQKLGQTTTSFSTSGTSLKRFNLNLTKGDNNNFRGKRLRLLTSYKTSPKKKSRSSCARYRSMNQSRPSFVGTGVTVKGRKTVLRGGHSGGTNGENLVMARRLPLGRFKGLRVHRGGPLNQRVKGDPKATGKNTATTLRRSGGTFYNGEEK